ncbi:MAG TPA: hypothetical protein VJU16_03440, partial [Planctomycetota bacterium]|nr:hypothetical protein [Planctomycetota bacterium]
MALVTRSRPETAESHFASIADRPFPFLIDWTDPDHPERPRTFIGSDPVRVLIAKGDRVTEWRAGRSRTRACDPFAALEKALKEHARDAGLAVGYFGYDLGGRLERLPHAAKDDRDLPDMVVAFHDRVLDLAEGRARRAEPTRPQERAISPEEFERHFGG